MEKCCSLTRLVVQSSLHSSTFDICEGVLVHQTGRSELQVFHYFAKERPVQDKKMAFTNKVFVVTGGNSGMGYDVARQLISEGAKVYITGRNPDAISKAASALGPNAIGVVADVSNVSDSTRLAKTIAANGDKVDGVFANAGVSEFVPFEFLSEEVFDRIFNTNVKGTYFTIQKLMPVLNDGASVVINGSNASHSGFAMSSAYAASKAALNSFAKTLSRDLLPRKIRVNVVNPGLTETPFLTKSDLPAEAVDAFLKQIVSQIPVGRIGQVADITGYVTFLLSDKSTFILGTELTIDGGATQL